MKKRTERNGNRTARSRKTGLVLAALFFAALLLAAFAGLFSGNSYADGARFLAEWPEGVYDVDEDINFEISISPLAAGKKVNGKITATIRGLDVIFLEPGPGFDIRTSRTPGVLVIEFSSDAGYFTTAAGKAVIAMLRCSIGSEDETKIQLAGSYTENGTNVTIPTSLFTIERYVPPTPTPSPHAGAYAHPGTGGHPRSHGNAFSVAHNSAHGYPVAHTDAHNGGAGNPHARNSNACKNSRSHRGRFRLDPCGDNSGKTGRRSVRPGGNRPCADRRSGVLGYCSHRGRDLDRNSHRRRDMEKTVHFRYGRGKENTGEKMIFRK